MAKGKTYASQFDANEKITIIGNNHRVELLTYFELSPKAREEFDYMDSKERMGEWNDARFFSYLGSWYDVNDGFERTGTYRAFPILYQWDGIQTESFFSGVLVKYLSGDDDRFIRVARYFTS